jgi:type IV fimbrial biogenesis protein FimT
MAFAAPSMSNLIASQRLRSSASSLYLALVQARTEAIKRNVPVTVSPAAGGWSAGWSILDPENPGGPALHAVALPAGVTVATDAAQIVFRGNGRTTLGALEEPEFVFTGGTAGASRCVSITPAGRPYAKEGSSC